MASLETDRLLASLEADRLSRQIASFEGEEREREGRLRETEPFSLLSGDLAREGGGLIWRLRFWEVSDWELDLDGGWERSCERAVSWELVDRSLARFFCWLVCWERWMLLADWVNIGFGTSSG